MRRTRNAVSDFSDRGFESLSLRQTAQGLRLTGTAVRLSLNIRNINTYSVILIPAWRFAKTGNNL